MKKFELTIVISKEENLNYSRILNRKMRYPRSDLAIKETKDTLKITITAKDATALRASSNSVLRDLQVIEAASKVE